MSVFCIHFASVLSKKTIELAKLLRKAKYIANASKYILAEMNFSLAAFKRYNAFANKLWKSESTCLLFFQVYYWDLLRIIRWISWSSRIYSWYVLWIVCFISPLEMHIQKLSRVSTISNEIECINFYFHMF